MENSFCRRVIAACEKYSDRTAVRIVGDDREVYSFTELLRQIRGVAYQIREQNIAVGDKIALIGENHPCWEIAYLGTLFAGAVCVPLDPHGEIETLTNFLENCEAKFAFLSPEMTGTFQQIEEKLGRKIPAAVWRMENSANGFQKFEDWANADFPESFARENPPATNEDVALLMYTSGTTGTPKGVPLTHGNIIAELDGIWDAVRLNDKDRVLSLLPLFHVYLQIVNLWVSTTYGCEIGYLKEMTPAELSDAMKAFKPTILTTVPRLWYLFHKKIFDAIQAKPKPVQLIFKTMFALNGFLRNNLKLNLGAKFFGAVHESFGNHLRFAITAGSRFDESVAEDFNKLGFTIIQGYGLTETSGAASATYENDNRVGSVGKPFVNAEFKLDQPNAEGIGEVLIKGGMVFSGYYKNEAATREVFTDDGFFRTGDLGTFDQNGNLYIVGRSKDVIVLPNGKNVHPEDLEVHYLKSPLVEELAILGVKDDSAAHAGAEKLVAVAVPDFAYLKQKNLSGAREAIRFDLDNLGRSLPEYQRVHEYIISGEPLPRTATKKIKRFELQKQIESGELSSDGKIEKPPLEFTPEDEKILESNAGKAVVAVLRQNSETAKTTEKIHPAMSLELDFGLDSLARAEVFAALEQNFSTEFSGEDAAQALTVGDVVELVKRSAPNAETNVSEIAANASVNWAKIVEQRGEDLPEVQSILAPHPIFNRFSYAFFKGFNLLCRALFQLEVKGAEKLEKIEKPFMVCPNHQSYLDAFFVSSNYPFDVFNKSFYVGASMYFDNFITAWLARRLSVIPIDADTQLMKAMKAGAAGLRHGRILNIYPEGERAFDGELHDFKKGAAILATELDVPIVPVALDGLYKVWARNSSRIQLAKVKITFGEPFFAKDIVKPEMNEEEKYEAVTAHLKETIQKMLVVMRADENKQLT